MKKNTKLSIGIILVVAVLLVAIGYATITTRQLNIDGTAQATPDSANFTVKFVGTPEVSDQDKVTAKITEDNDLKATIDVKGLTAKGDTATAKYTIQNSSKDLSAALSATVTSNTNSEYFTVDYDIADSTIAHGDSTTILVTVTLIKTPIDDEQTSTIGITVKADPQQPNA